MEQQLTSSPLNQCPVAWQAQHNGDAIALQSDNDYIPYGELHQRIQHLGMQLRNLGMQQSDRLVAIASNGLQLILLQLTCIRHGFIFCPLNPKFSDAEIAQRLAILDSHFLWQADNPKSLRLEFNVNPTLATSNSAQRIDSLAITNIIFTSGSSGTPKAVMHHFSNHYYSALGSQSMIPLQRGDNNLLSLPIFHISGYATVIRSILAGATLQLSQQRLSVSLLQQRNISHLSLVAAQLTELLKESSFTANSLSIKHLLLGGSAFPSKLLNELPARHLDFHLSYGSTEMASQIATSHNNEQLQLLPYRKLKIQEGEITLSGETRFAGYFTGAGEADLIAPEAYFFSADLGILMDQQIQIVGRKDRQFISGGENIQPEEIEKALLGLTSILQAYVLPIDDEHYGQRPIAFIKWQAQPQWQQLREFIATKLVTYKRPRYYFLLPESQGLKVNPRQLTDIATKLVQQNRHF